MLFENPVPGHEVGCSKLAPLVTIGVRILAWYVDVDSLNGTYFKQSGEFELVVATLTRRVSEEELSPCSRVRLGLCDK